MTVEISGVEIWGVFTPLLLTALAVGGLILDLTVFRKKPRAMGIYTICGLAVVLLLQHLLQARRLNLTSYPALAFGGQYGFDLYSMFFNYLFLLAALVACILSLSYLKDTKNHRSEYYFLLLFATAGMCVMAAAHNLLVFFVGLETMSIAVYVLVGFERGRLRSGEASIKYLLLGAFASAVLLYGLAFIYGATGELDYRSVSSAISDLFEKRDLILKAAIFDELGFKVANAREAALLFGVILFLVGLFFKVAAVPFHMWTPDVYEGAPTPITAYMATGVKAAAFAGLLRVAIFGFTSLWSEEILFNVVWILAVLTMTLGNLVAIAQRNLKRMLAYSSIAHAGYVLVAVVALFASSWFSAQFPGTEGKAAEIAHVLGASSSVLFYLLAYTFMNLGAFGVISAVSKEVEEGETLEGFAGLSRRRPALAAVMAVCMFSLAGIPPFAGFAAKFYVFQSAVACRLYVLAVIGVLNSVVSAYYYLRVVVVMFMAPPAARELRPGQPPMVTGAWAANVLMAAAVVAMGVFPGKALLIVSKVFSPEMIDLVIH